MPNHDAETRPDLRAALELSAEQAVAAQRPVTPDFYADTAPNGGSEIPYAVVPDGYKVVSLAEQIFHNHRPRPTRVEGAVSVATVSSFIDYVRRFRTLGTLIEADLNARIFRAKLDYHEDADLPSWNKHSVTLTLALSRQLAAWKANDGKAMEQVEFATFLEDHAEDVENSADLVEVARNLNATKNVVVKSANNLANGAIVFAYSEEVNGTVNNGKTVIPQTFDLKLPLFRYDEPTRIVARFRYRLGDGKLKLFYNLHRLDDLLEERATKALELIESGTNVKAVIVG